MISAQQYAEKVGVTASYIGKILKYSKTLPFAKSISKYFHTWQIELSEDFDATEARELLKTYKTK